MIRCWLGAACFSRSHNYNLHDFGDGAVVGGCNLQVALAGFKKKEVKVYTEHGKLVVEGKKEEKKEHDCCRTACTRTEAVAKDQIFPV